MATERQILLNLYKSGATIYRWNTYNPETGRLVCRTVNEIPRRADDTQPIDVTNESI